MVQGGALRISCSKCEVKLLRNVLGSWRERYLRHVEAVTSRPHHRAAGKLLLPRKRQCRQVVGARELGWGLDHTSRGLWQATWLPPWPSVVHRAGTEVCAEPWAAWPCRQVSGRVRGMGQPKSQLWLGLPGAVTTESALPPLRWAEGGWTSPCCPGQSVAPPSLPVDGHCSRELRSAQQSPWGAPKSLFHLAPATLTTPLYSA